MSPRSRVGRDDWVRALLGLLDQGRVPGEVSLTELSGLVGPGMTKGSFYSPMHFGSGGIAALHVAVITEWQRSRIAGLPDTTVGLVRDPLDRLRLIRAAAGAFAVRDDAMRRWAATSPAAVTKPARAAIPKAAAAVAEVDRIVTNYLEPALVDLGLTGPESAAMARYLAAALRDPAVAGDEEQFNTVLGVLARAAEFPQDGAARELTADERRALQRIQRFLAADPASEELLPGQAETGKA
jgi:hypothetical protein